MGQFFYTTLSGTPFVDSDRIVLFITFLYSIYSIMATNRPNWWQEASQTYPINEPLTNILGRKANKTINQPNSIISAIES